MGKKENSVADCSIQNLPSKITRVSDPHEKSCYSVGDYTHSAGTYIFLCRKLVLLQVKTEFDADFGHFVS